MSQQDFDDSQMIFDEQPGQSMKTMEDVITQIESIDLIVPNLKIDLEDENVTDDRNNEQETDEKLTNDDEEITNLEGGASLEINEEQQEKDNTPILIEYCVTKPDDPTCVDKSLTGTLVWLKDNDEFVENGEVYAKIFITKTDKENVVGEDKQQEKKIRRRNSKRRQ